MTAAVVNDFAAQFDWSPAAIAERTEQARQAYELFTRVVTDFVATLNEPTHPAQWQFPEKLVRTAVGLLHLFLMRNSGETYYFAIHIDWISKSNVIYKVDREYFQSVAPDLLTSEMLASDDTATETWCTRCRLANDPVSVVPA